jgi:WD40-like Beta Propeller Repeat
VVQLLRPRRVRRAAGVDGNARQEVLPMRRARAPLAAAIVVASVALVAVRASEALHRNTPAFVQITNQPSTVLSDPSFAGTSNVLIFSSDADLLGNGNAHSQIFVFDLKFRSKKNELGIFQLTFGSQDSFEPTAARRARTIAFHSPGDLLGNGSTGRQVFAAKGVRVKHGIVPLAQVTRGPGESYNAILSGAGKYLAFTSTADLLNQGLAPGNHLYRTELTRLLKSTCPGYPCPAEGNPGLELVSPAEASHVAIDKKGTRIAFVSTADAAGTGCVNGSAQVFLHDFKTGTVQQITCGVGDSRNPVFSRDNKTILFESDADLTVSGSTHTQIYQLDLRSEPYVLSQRTFGTDGDSTDPAPNGTRTKDRFFFVSTANLTGGVTPGTPRLYQFDEAKGLVVLTDGAQILSGISGQFTFVTFVSDADLVGNGNDQLQMFLINSFPFLDS